MHLKSVYYSKYIAVVDMALLWQLSTPSSAEREKDDGTVYTWIDYGDKVFEIILRGRLYGDFQPGLKFQLVRPS